MEIQTEGEDALSFDVENTMAYEILPPLPETKADIAVREGLVVTRCNVILPFSSGYNGSLMPRQHYSSNVTKRDVCRLNVGGESKLMVVVVPNGMKYLSQCSGIRNAFTTCVRFVAYFSHWWLPIALSWVSDCHKFIASYGIVNTPPDIIRSMDEIEKRLFRWTQFPGEALDVVCPTGAYAILFTNAKQHSFCFRTAVFCTGTCENSKCKSEDSYGALRKVRKALLVLSRSREENKCTCTVTSSNSSIGVNRPANLADDRNLYVKTSRGWHLSDEYYKCDIPVGVVFAKSGVHIAHWNTDKGREHALVVGPLERKDHLVVVYYLRQLGLSVDIKFVRNDLGTRRFSRDS